jgi:hypothetical protein
MPGKKKPRPASRIRKVYEEIREQADQRRRRLGSSMQRRHGAGPRLERTAPARVWTGPSMTGASVSRSWAYRGTPARTNLNWSPC